VQALVLEWFVGSEYEDSPTSYEFPSRYLRHFEPLSRGEPMVAVIYEPRGDGSGRMAYVGWAPIEAPPVASGRRNRRGEPLWTVHYTGTYRNFDRPVPRHLGGEPVEAWLREIEAGRPRNVATFGRAVRPLSPADLETIFRFAFASDLDAEVPYRMVDAEATPELQVRERATRLVASAQREASFRDDVLASYAHRCAVTGFSAGIRSPSRMFGLLDAAHIRPVRGDGPDDVFNGLALTPTVHRLFDRGLFTLTYQGDRPELLLSPRFDETMIRSPDGSSKLVLQNGRQLFLPRDRRCWPHPDALAYHREQVFIRD